MKQLVVLFSLTAIVGGYVTSNSFAQNTVSTTTCSGPRHAVSGTVSDTGGGLVPSARITATCRAFNEKTQTNQNGEYHLSLPTGSFHVEAKAEGFAPGSITFEVSQAPQQQAASVILPVASAKSVVTVTAEGGMITPYAQTSTKTDTPILEQPFSITTVAHDQLIQQNPQSMVEALSYTTGAQTLSVNGPAVMSVDSFALRGTAADEYLDGLRIPQSFNTVQSGPASLQLDPNDMQQLDILLGPSSMLYGQSNLGGIVDAISKQPSITPIRSLQLEIGSYSRYQGSADFSGSIDATGRMQYRINGIVRRADTFVYGMQDNRWTLNPTLTWHPSLNTTMTGYAKYLRNSSDSITAYVPAAGTISAAAYGFLPWSINLSDPTYDRYRKNQIFAGYSINHRSAGRWQVKHQLRYVHSDANMHFLYLTGVGSDGVTATRTNYLYIPTIEGIQTDTHAQTSLKTGWMKHTLLGGADFQWQQLHSRQGFGIGSTIDVTHPVYGQGDTVPALSVDQRQTQFQGGLYGQEQMDFSHLTVIAGGRVDFTAQNTYDNLAHKSVASQNPNAFSGHVGASYHLVGIAPYFSYSTSFLPTLGSDVNGKPYVPVTGSNLEGGVKYQLINIPMMLRAAVFSMRQHNVLQPNPAAPTTSIQTGEVHTPGFELQANGTALHSMDYSVGYTHIHPVNTMSTYYQDKQPTTVSNNAVSAWLHYTVRHGLPAGLGFGAGNRYVGSSWGTVTNDLRVPSFTLFDAALDYTMEKWRFAINARNLGDRRYVNGCSNQFFCAYGSPRTVIAIATFTF